MFYATCPNCGAHLEITKRDITGSSDQTQDVLCPKCKALATKVYRSQVLSVQERR